ncbi:MAG: serine hydrolase [Pseudomonadota bacterium]
MAEAPLNAKIRDAFEAGSLTGLHGVYATLDGEVLANVYFDGEDTAWGRDLGVVAHGPDTLHDVRSVSKTVVALLYGIALEAGKVPPADTPLYDAFADHAALGEGREAIRIEHALTMTLGLEWDETLPYTDPKNSEIAMEQADDRIAYVLSRKVVAEPGSTWNYSGGATALIGELIERGTGMALDDYAEAVLFAPLGITEFEWVGREGAGPAAASGLRLTLPDLGKIGAVLANGGRFGETAIVSPAFIEEMFTAKAYEPTGLGYGYFTYVSWPGLLSEWRAGFGNGGQRVAVHPAEGLVIAISAGRYDDPNAWRLGVSVAARFIYPAVRARVRAAFGR